MKFYFRIPAKTKGDVARHPEIIAKEILNHFSLVTQTQDEVGMAVVSI